MCFTDGRKRKITFKVGHDSIKWATRPKSEKYIVVKSHLDRKYPYGCTYVGHVSR